MKRKVAHNMESKREKQKKRRYDKGIYKGIIEKDGSLTPKMAILLGSLLIAGAYEKLGLGKILDELMAAMKIRLKELGIS